MQTSMWDETSQWRGRFGQFSGGACRLGWCASGGLNLSWGQMPEGDSGSTRRTFHQSELSNSRWECMTQEWDACIPGNIQILVYFLKCPVLSLICQPIGFLLVSTCSCQGAHWPHSQIQPSGLPCFIYSLCSLCPGRKQPPAISSSWVFLLSFAISSSSFFSHC